MFPIRLVFLAMGISMVLSTAVSGGESPNDKMDDILAVVYSLSDRMNNLDTKVENTLYMEKLTAQKVLNMGITMDKLAGKVEKMEPIVNEIDYIQKLTVEKVYDTSDKVDKVVRKVENMEFKVDGESNIQGDQSYCPLPRN